MKPCQDIEKVREPPVKEGSWDGINAELTPQAARPISHAAEHTAVRKSPKPPNYRALSSMPSSISQSEQRTQHNVASTLNKPPSNSRQPSLFAGPFVNSFPTREIGGTFSLPIYIIYSFCQIGGTFSLTIYVRESNNLCIIFLHVP